MLACGANCWSVWASFWTHFCRPTGVWVDFNDFSRSMFLFRFSCFFHSLQTCQSRHKARQGFPVYR